MNCDVVVGVDQSSTSTGVVVLNVTGEYLYSYLIQPPKKLTFDERVLYTQRVLEEILLDLSSNLKCLGLESVAMFAKGRVVQLAGLFGLIKYSVMKNGTCVYEFTPSSVKKYATGNGRADKQDVIDILPENVRLDFLDINESKIDDLADAYFIARMTAEKYLLNLK